MTKLRSFLVGLFVLLVYVGFASTWTVRQNEEGVRVRLGRPVGTVSGGLHVTLPYPIERIVRVPTTEVRVVQVGFSPDDGLDLFRSATQSDSHWLTGDTNIVELRADVLYTVTDPVAYLYGFAASDAGTTHEDLIRAASETVLTRLLAGTTIESTLATGKIELSRRGLRETQSLLDELRAGVRLSAMNIAEVNPPDRVISAFNDVSSAKADRDRLLAEAEGIAGTVLPRAQARAREATQSAHTFSNELTSRALGEAESFVKLATEVAKNPQASRERLWLESIERILRKTDERVVPPGSKVYVAR
ncbi:MAG: FtsH protease activity modulator HflK [Planctomycetota bacterium]